MAVNIKGFDHAGFSTDDFDRTRTLVENVLGLEPIPSLKAGFPDYKLAWYKDSAGNEYHVSARIPDLAERLGADFNQSMYPHVAFEVESLEQAKEELERHGFEYHELKDDGILARKQVYVLLEESGQMLELFETKKDVEPVYVPPEETR